MSDSFTMKTILVTYKSHLITNFYLKMDHLAEVTAVAAQFP